MSETWKMGNEFALYHPQASHCSPDYRDGWNDCYRAALALHPSAAPATISAGVRDEVVWLPSDEQRLDDAIAQRRAQRAFREGVPQGWKVICVPDEWQAYPKEWQRHKPTWSTPTQPDAVPVAEPAMCTWRRAIDEALIANCQDCTSSTESADHALARLITWEVQVATDPTINWGQTAPAMQGGVAVAADLTFHLRIARLLAELHGESTLSEQQCAKYMGIDLVSWRKLEHCFSAGTSMCEAEGEEWPAEDSEAVLRAALASHPAAPGQAEPTDKGGV